MFSNTLFETNVTYPWVYFLRAIWRGNVNVMWNFFEIAEIPQGRALE